MLKSLFDRKITPNMIFVFIVCIAAAVSVAVGVALMSYQDYNLEAAQKQSAYSLEALGSRLESQKLSALNYTAQISRTSSVIDAVEASDGNDKY